MRVSCRRPNESPAKYRVETRTPVHFTELRLERTERRAAQKRILGQAGLRIGRPDRHGAIWTERRKPGENHGDTNSPERHQRAAWNCVLAGQKELLCHHRPWPALWHR